MDREAPRLLDVVRQKIRARHYSLQTEKVYTRWIRRFIRFHQRQHPRCLGRPEIERFLTYLAVERRVAAATQNQALSAILFLYQAVLEIQLPWLQDIVRAKRSQHVPVVPEVPASITLLVVAIRRGRDPRDSLLLLRRGNGC